jgi:hypothetical protein
LKRRIPAFHLLIQATVADHAASATPAALVLEPIATIIEHGGCKSTTEERQLDANNPFTLRRALFVRVVLLVSVHKFSVLVILNRGDVWSTGAPLCSSNR